jgi:rubrerythrin
MAKLDAVEHLSHFEKGVQKWKRLEDTTIESCEAIAKATDNVLVKTIAGLIRSDSEKHKQVLGIITDTLNGIVSLTPEELGSVAALIEEHLKLEKNSITLAEQEYEESRHFVIRHLLSYLLMDEQKHYKLLSQLRDFQRQLYPYA